MRKKNRKPKQLKGGLGGTAPAPLIPKNDPELIDSRTPGKDLKLIGAAVNNGWVIREQAMTALPDTMLAIALDRSNDTRARVSAAKVLCTMYGQNKPSEGTTVNVGVVVNNGDDLLD